MVDEEPVEPSAVVVRAPRRPVPDRLPRLRAPALPAWRRRLVPSVVSGAAGGTVVTASALAVAAIAAARAVAIARRLAWPDVGPAAHDLLSRTAPPGGSVQISWTHVEIRWLPRG
jgi:hypothetical protein